MKKQDEKQDEKQGAALRHHGAAMNIHVQAGEMREVAETLGRYFEARAIGFHIDERPDHTLHIGFENGGHRASVTVSFDDGAYEDFTQRDLEGKRHALKRISNEFGSLMEQRGPGALAGDFRVNRLDGGQ